VLLSLGRSRVHPKRHVEAFLSNQLFDLAPSDPMASGSNVCQTDTIGCSGCAHNQLRTAVEQNFCESDGKRLKKSPDFHGTARRTLSVSFLTVPPTAGCARSLRFSTPDPASAWRELQPYHRVVPTVGDSWGFFEGRIGRVKRSSTAQQQ
jgi:hypothetical protein